MYMKLFLIFSHLIHILGTRHRSWLRHGATSQKVAGSIPDSVIGIFHWHIPSGRTVELGLTQPLTEMGTRNVSWVVKAAGTKGLQPYHLHVPIVLKSGSLSLLKSSEPVRACNGIALPFIHVYANTGWGNMPWQLEEQIFITKKQITGNKFVHFRYDCSYLKQI